MPELRREHAVAFGILAGAAILFYAAHNSAGGSRPPKYAHGGVTEDVYNVPDPVQPVTVDPDAGYLTTQHRYPHRVGHEITCLIQGGHSAASVPKYLTQAYMIVKPPSELVL